MVSRPTRCHFCGTSVILADNGEAVGTFAKGEMGARGRVIEFNMYICPDCSEEFPKWLKDQVAT